MYDNTDVSESCISRNTSINYKTWVVILVHVFEENRFGQPDKFKHSITTTTLLKRSYYFAELPAARYV